LEALVPSNPKNGLRVSNLYLKETGAGLRLVVEHETVDERLPLATTEDRPADQTGYVVVAAARSPIGNFAPAV